MALLQLPEAFISAMQVQLGQEWPAFLEALSSPPPVSIRKHFLKQISWKENFEKVKWSTNGVYLPERPVFTLDPAFHAGAYYVQEASSMLLEAVVRQLCPLNQAMKVLDLAAAPGGKSTLLAELLSPDSLLLANEVIRTRFQVLKYNLAKWGYPNCLTSNHDSRDFGNLQGWFDLVLLDAPCSGEGLFRKDPEAALEWSPENVKLCSGRQKRILADAAALVRPGGALLYSTCTYNAEENTGNVEWFIREYGFEHCPLEFPAEWGIRSKNMGYQCFPHLVRGEGFFLAALRKKPEKPASTASKAKKIPFWEPLPPKLLDLVHPWLERPDQFLFFLDKTGNVRALPKSLEPWTVQVNHALRRVDWGLEMGQIKGKDLIPSPALALSTAVSSALPGVELDRQTALRYLKKEPVELAGAANGWVLARYQGLNLGWAKVLANRVNNYYPKEWRILMDVQSARPDQIL